MILTMSKKELEQAVEKALENACAYHAIRNYRKAMEYTGEAYAYLDMLESINVWYDDIIINKHCNNMLEILEKSLYEVTYQGQKE